MWADWAYGWPTKVPSRHHWYHFGQAIIIAQRDVGWSSAWSDLNSARRRCQKGRVLPLNPWSDKKIFEVSSSFNPSAKTDEMCVIWPPTLSEVRVYDMAPSRGVINRFGMRNSEKWQYEHVRDLPLRFSRLFSPWSGVKGANVQTWDPGHESDIQQPADVSMCLLFICSISRTTSGKGQEGWTYWRSICWLYQILSICSF